MALPMEWVLKLQGTEVLAEMAPADKRKGTDTLTFFLLSSDLLPMLPLGDVFELICLEILNQETSCSSHSMHCNLKYH